MAKKVSKRSRAARRNEIEEPEAKSLASLPRADSNDTTSAMIRATMKKNESLLMGKLQKKERTKNKITKDTTITNLNKDRVERAIYLNHRLEGKIIKSKERAKMVQTTRKSNWDSINDQVSKTALVSTTTTTIITNEANKEEEVQVAQEDQDAMEDDFYEDVKPQKKQTNAFALLDEVEC